jgi:regulator of protease activity HflC (stomatin/prohibitin superfamily)
MTVFAGHAAAAPVQPDEEGVETLFGKYSKTTISGLHYRPPSPITKIYKVKVTRVNTEEIGYRNASGNSDDAFVLIESLVCEIANRRRLHLCQGARSKQEEK